jgi:hypothetical protein
MTTCGDQHATNPLYNVPRDVISYSGDTFSASKCVQKCLYWYNYGASACVVTNEGDRLSMQYDGGGDVTFNAATYQPTIVYVFKPSLHKFNGVQAEGELVIQHAAKSAANTGLLVCIPLSTEGVRSNASVLLEDIVAHAPIATDVAESLSISDFNLNTLIPTAPYYTYSGPLPYDKCSTSATYQYVVFHPSRDGSIALSKTSMAALGALVNLSFVVAFKGPGIFFNETGTTKNGYSGEDQIYIQCQPAGESSDEVIYKENTGIESGSMNGMSVSSFLYVILGVLVVFGSYKLMEFTLNTLAKQAPTYTYAK